MSTEQDEEDEFLAAVFGPVDKQSDSTALEQAWEEQCERCGRRFWWHLEEVGTCALCGGPGRLTGRFMDPDTALSLRRSRGHHGFAIEGTLQEPKGVNPLESYSLRLPVSTRA